MKKIVITNNFTISDISNLTGVSVNIISNIEKFSKKEVSKYIDFDFPRPTGKERVKHYTEAEAMKFVKFLELMKTDKRAKKIFDREYMRW